MNDDVLCIRLSQDGKLLAVSLLDSTVKIFYTDSLKFFLSLYGHKLPVVSMDISSDGLLIATASSDKSIKIWGLDFGDCHASLRAHEDSVMGVKFVFGTHFLASVSKDKTLKLWDIDSRAMIQKLAGHFGEVWCLCVGKYGNFLLTGSHDRSIIKWEKTSDQFILEESREEQLEEVYDRMDLDSYEPQDSLKETSTPNLKTSETLKAGEKIQLVLELCEEESSLLHVMCST
jgi:U3 small nucleolar RNA-associated protein 12